MKEIINYGEARRQQILKGFTNIDEVAEEAPIEKARHGVYADNAQNRRLQRVGQEYGHAAKEDPEAGQEGNEGVPEGNVSLQNHARQASEEALVKVANDPSADAEMRKVATAELERRGVNVRAKNKKGDQSLRNGLADGDAKSASTFESMGFRQMDDRDLEQYAGVEDASHAFIKQVGGDKGVGQELLSHPELKKIADERQAARDSLRGEYDPEEYRKKVDAQIEVMKRTNKEFVDKFLEIYGSNTEE